MLLLGDRGTLGNIQSRYRGGTSLFIFTVIGSTDSVSLEYDLYMKK